MRTVQSSRRAIIPAKVFVGNLNYQTTKEQLTEFMSSAGEVVDVYLPADRATGRPRGFAFVEFSSEDEAEKAIEEFDGKEMEGRPLRVNIAAERAPRVPHFNNGGGGGGFNGPRGGGGRPSRPKGSRRGLRGKKRSL